MTPVTTYHDLIRWDIFAMIPRPARRILDVGGGIGATSAAAKEFAGADHVVLIDQVANEAASGVDIAIPANLDDIPALQDLLNEHGPFDTILCLDVLEHLYDPWRTVSVLDAALAPNGALIISLPNMNFIGLVGPLVLKGRFDLADSGVMDRTHIRWFTPQGGAELACSSGLKLEATSFNIYGRKKQIIDRLTMGKLTRFLAMQYAFRVRKPAT